MNYRAEAFPVQEVPEGSVVCQHHWLIQAADGPTSAGVCRICGEARDFKNYIETATWGDTRLTNRQDLVPAGAVVVSSDDPWDDE